MRVLVTGATGFVGANLTRRLVEDGYDVYILTRKTSKKWRLLDVLPKINECTADLLELAKLEKIAKKIKPGIIFHLATAGVYGGKHLPERKLIETNFIGTFNLINACANINYKCFVNTGSSSEYGPKDKAMKETDICEPINLYGITKLASTLYSRYIGKLKGKPIITLRLFSPFGPYDDPSRLVTYAITSALRDKELKLANPNAVRDYIYIDDVLDLYIKCINKADKYQGEIFNVGRGLQTNISYIVENIVKLTNSSSLVRWNTVPPRSFDAKNWQADITLAKKLLEWSPKHNINLGIKKTIEWMKKNLQYYQ